MKDFLLAQDNLFYAPSLIFLTLPKDASKWAILDAGAFEEAILLSAANKGIDSIVAYSIIKYPDMIRKYLPIPDNEDSVIGIALGDKEEAATINRIHSKRIGVSDILTIC